MSSSQAQLIESLKHAEAYPHATAGIRLVETHISYVLLTGTTAYKIKKDVRLPFVDFSTLERRKRFCDDELALNRRLAPELYRDVVPIGGDARQPRVGEEPAIEYAVAMSQFPDDALADRLVDENALAPRDFVRLADRIAAFHAALEPADVEPGAPEVLDNLDELHAALPGAPPAAMQQIDGWVRREHARLGPTLRARADAGFVRECHGDLHLGNVVRVDDALLPFDCLEFDRALRTIDVIDEVAFLYMDLVHRERVDLAWAFVNRWLELTGGYAGLEVLRLFATHRALVRAKVAAIRERQRDGSSADRSASTGFIATAGAITDAPPPVLAITRGLSGSGKTTIARELARAAGAVHVRSDIERKRLNDLPADARTGAGVAAGIYSAAATEQTYERLAILARHALDGGFPVIVDAAFLARAQRERFRALADDVGCRLVILSCEAQTATLEQRIRRRDEEGRDASEANLDVLRHQLETAETFGEDERSLVVTVDTEGAPDMAALAEKIRPRAGQVSLSSTSY